MGLETVEIVLWAEKEFQITIPDKEARDILTVAEFSEYLSRRSSTSYEEVLEKLSQRLVNEYQVPQEKISPESRFYKDLGLG